MRLFFNYGAQVASWIKVYLKCVDTIPFVLGEKEKKNATLKI